MAVLFREALSIVAIRSGYAVGAQVAPSILARSADVGDVDADTERRPSIWSHHLGVGNVRRFPDKHV